MDGRMRRACSPYETWGAGQRSRFAELASNCLKDRAKPTRKNSASRVKKLLRLASAYDRAIAPKKSHLPRLSKRQRLWGHDTPPLLKSSRPPLSTTP